MISFPLSFVMRVCILQGCPLIMVLRFVVVLTVASGEVDPSVYCKVIGCSMSGQPERALTKSGVCRGFLSHLFTVSRQYNTHTCRGFLREKDEEPLR